MKEIGLIPPEPGNYEIIVRKRVGSYYENIFCKIRIQMTNACSAFAGYIGNNNDPYFVIGFPETNIEPARWKIFWDRKQLNKKVWTIIDVEWDQNYRLRFDGLQLDLGCE